MAHPNAVITPSKKTPMEQMAHHNIRKAYLGAYASEMAWREDHRRESNGVQFVGIAQSAAQHPVSRQWKGYWERHLPKLAATHSGPVTAQASRPYSGGSCLAWIAGR